MMDLFYSRDVILLQGGRGVGQGHMYVRHLTGSHGGGVSVI